MLQDYLMHSGVPYTILQTSIFYENALSVYSYRKQEDGSVAFALNGGTKPHPNCAVGDIGASAAGTPAYLSIGTGHQAPLACPSDRAYC